MKYSDTELMEFLEKYVTNVVFLRRYDGLNNGWQISASDTAFTAGTIREAVSVALTAHRRASITAEERMNYLLNKIGLYDTIGEIFFPAPVPLSEYSKPSKEEIIDAIDRNFLREKELFYDR